MAPKDPKDDPDDEPTREIPPEVTGAIDVQFSSTAIPQVQDPAPSGSVDVNVSQSMPIPVPVVRRRRATTVPGMLAESFANLPVVKEVLPKSRKGRLMVRSILVAFTLISVWIGLIVYLQLRGEERPDLRPQIEAIFADLSQDKIEQVYDQSSVRMQELTLADTFEHAVREQNDTLGVFIEVAAVIRTETFRGPSGRTARADLLLDFENGRCQGSVSFLFEDGVWKMLGFRVELPEDLAAIATSAEKRAARVRAPQEVIDLAIKILEQSRDGESAKIYDEADQVFRDSVTDEADADPKAKFLALETQRRDALGAFRYLHVTTAKQNPTGDGAAVDGVATFGDTSVTQAVSLKFKKVDGVWKLASYKVILPLPRAGKK